MNDSPLIVKLSGGRSSGLMLRLLLDDGRFVRGRDFAVFTNTGAEHPATLDFLREIERRWEVPIVWLEYHRREDQSPRDSWRRVDYDSAARDGEPFFTAMTASHCGVIPHAVSRKCTAMLKVSVSDKWQKDNGISDPVIALGYRRGEEQRRARALSHGEKRMVFPLMDAGIDNAGVIEWWRDKSDFDLGLPTIAGRTKHGNCTLCFMKSAQTIMELIAECPKRADFWIRLEDKLEEKRNDAACRWWLNREDPKSAWKKIRPPDTPDPEKHRQDSDGQWWEHDGRWHRVSILPHKTYRELAADAAAGIHLRGRRTRDADLFLDSPNPQMPCECGD